MTYAQVVHYGDTSGVAICGEPNPRAVTFRPSFTTCPACKGMLERSGLLPQPNPET
jgi:hypothetical protein